MAKRRTAKPRKRRPPRVKRPTVHDKMDALKVALEARLNFLDGHFTKKTEYDSRRIDDLVTQFGVTGRGYHTVAQGVLAIVTERNQDAERRINDLETRIMKLERGGR